MISAAINAIQGTTIFTKRYTRAGINQVGWRIQGPDGSDETFYLDDVIFCEISRPEAKQREGKRIFSIFCRNCL